MNIHEIRLTRTGAWRGAILLFAFVLVGAWTARVLRAAQNESPSSRVSTSDPWSATDLLAPAALAKELASPAATGQPLVLCVGFPPLYHGAHVPGAGLAGPASRPEGIAALKRAVEGLARDQSIVIYCGCCPLKDCPNVRPAFRTLQELGFRRVQVLLLPDNFQQDWTAKGYPIQKGDDAH